MATKNNPGKFDCYEKAEPDEPIFVLLGRDVNAPTLVWLWSVLREIHGEDAEKVGEAKECAVRMIQFAQSKGKQVGGLGESVLAGVMELIRSVNFFVKRDHTLLENEPTTFDLLRVMLSQTKLRGVNDDANHG